MPSGYHIEFPNGNSDVVYLCDKDGNIIAKIMPMGGERNRRAVVDMIDAAFAHLEESISC